MNAYGTPAMDDWPTLRDFWRGFKESVWADRIQVTEEEFAAHFLHSLVAPHLIGILCGYVDGALQGVVAVKAVLIEENGQSLPATFIAGAHVLPGAGLAFSDGLHKYMEQWSRARGHKLWRAHVRPPEDGANNYKLRALDERYGFKVVCILTERRLQEVE